MTLSRAFDTLCPRQSSFQQFQIQYQYHLRPALQSKVSENLVHIARLWQYRDRVEGFYSASRRKKIVVGGAVASGCRRLYLLASAAQALGGGGRWWGM
jgi:hypothetical protein